MEVTSLPALFEMRQSTLATWSHCPLSARFEIEASERNAPPLARGSLFHRVAEEILRTLHRQGARQMPQAEALEVMFEIMAAQGVESADVLTIPSAERVALRQCVVRFATDYEWRTERILALETQLHHDIVCEDGVTRRVTGTPDVLLAEPRESAVVLVDFKTGLRAPPKPRTEEPYDPKRYLTERGTFQLDCYGLLALKAYPAADKIVMREIHVRVGEERTATLHRDELEHVERLIGLDLMLLDRALTEGPDSPIWKAVGGTRQCDWCIRKDLCPRPAFEREGITDLPMAIEVAQDVVAISARRDTMLKMLKGHVDEAGPVPLPMGKVYGWQETVKDGKTRRSFCVHEPEAPE